MHPPRGDKRVASALILSLATFAGCDSLLDVDLPAQLTDAALENPAAAQTLVESSIALFECGYSAMVYGHVGDEDVWEVIAGVASGTSRYVAGAETGDCDSDSEDGSWFDQITSARALAQQTYEKMENDWTDQQVKNRARLQAEAALYVAASLDVFGELFCEMALDAGPLMTPNETLTVGEEWIERALSKISATGDFEMPNGITGPSDGNGAEEMAYALRARMRWAKGDNQGALADIARVPAGFTAWVSREVGLTRRNKVYNAGTGIGFSGMLDVNTWWQGPPNPVTGQPWPSPIPFTGYLNLGILPNGRAVTEAGVPIRTTVDATAVADPRVAHFVKTIQGPEPRDVPDKYKSDEDDIPLVNSRELALIKAEIQGGQAAIEIVNQLRSAAGLPLVTYANPSNAEQIRRMIIEERRRELFLEGRFIVTKIRNTDILWFPRGVGATPFQGYTYFGSVRYTMPEAEYNQNTNFTLADRGTLCDADERPLFIN